MGAEKKIKERLGGGMYYLPPDRFSVWLRIMAGYVGQDVTRVICNSARRDSENDPSPFFVRGVQDESPASRPVVRQVPQVFYVNGWGGGEGRRYRDSNFGGGELGSAMLSSFFAILSYWSLIIAKICKHVYIMFTQHTYTRYLYKHQQDTSNTWLQLRLPLILPWSHLSQQLLH